MDLKEYAEQVLFGTTVADKLVDPGRLTDATPGPGLGTVTEPGRPPGLRFEDRGDRQRVKRVGAAVLDDPARAGRLLHAFANHELLAAELMSLVLLRFPHAPGPFRRALGQTLREEQRHLQLYLDRMADFGVGFGEVPVNRFFWSAVADVVDPLDFVVRMGLVFEQANLDFTRLYAARFREVGDEETAAILDIVHADELGHVRHGLHWFRTWKDPERDEFEAFAARLRPPLGPSRAKAPGYDRAERLRLGFTPTFLDQLEVWGRTRGRPPTVWCFDPTAETELAGRHPKAAVTALRRDLAGLMGALAATGDTVLVSRRPDAAFVADWQAAGLPEVEWMDAGDPPGDHLGGLAGRKLSGLQPWGWTPRSRARLAPLEPSLVATARLPQLPDRAAWSKATAHHLHDTLFSELAGSVERSAPPGDWLAPRAHLGRVIHEARELTHVADLGQGIVLKAPFSTSGGGLRRAPSTTLDEPTRRWLDKRLATGDGVVVAPWLDRIADLSFHLDLDAEGQATFVDWCRPVVDRRGQFLGAVLGRRLADLPADVRRFLFGDGRDPHRLRHLGARLARLLAPKLHTLGVNGPVGIDAFVYRHQGQLLLHPLVELNPRWTMGRVALALERHLHPGRTGWWQLVRAQDVGPLSEWAARLPRPRFERRHLHTGPLLTTPPTRCETFGSVLVAGDHLGDCRATLARLPT